jgi:drug/metabolite transporter (DMT)-like permease
MALSKSKQSRPSILNPLARIALGILGAVAYAVGVNLTGYVPQAVVGEALTFFVAGIISYAGGLPKKGDA